MHFTAKDFRTWHGTAQALELTRLACTQSGDSPAQAFSARQVLVEVARQLGNTPAVCKKSYAHPAVLELGERLASDAGPGLQRVWKRIGGAARLERGRAGAAGFLAAAGSGKAAQGASQGVAQPHALRGGGALSG